MLALLTYTASASSIINHAAADNFGSSSTAQMNTWVSNRKFTPDPRTNPTRPPEAAHRIQDPVEFDLSESPVGAATSVRARGPVRRPASPPERWSRAHLAARLRSASIAGFSLDECCT